MTAPFAYCVMLKVVFEPHHDYGCLLAGTGDDDEIHKPGESGRFSTPDGGAARHRNVLHSLVLCVSFLNNMSVNILIYSGHDSQDIQLQANGLVFGV